MNWKNYNWLICELHLEGVPHLYLLWVSLYEINMGGSLLLLVNLCPSRFHFVLFLSRVPLNFLLFLDNIILYVFPLGLDFDNPWLFLSSKLLTELEQILLPIWNLFSYYVPHIHQENRDEEGTLEPPNEEQLLVVKSLIEEENYEGEGGDR